MGTSYIVRLFCAGCCLSILSYGSRCALSEKHVSFFCFINSTSILDKLMKNVSFFKEKMEKVFVPRFSIFVL